MTPELNKAAVYTDFQGLTGLKASAKSQSPEAVRAVAKQFEALFLQMMLKTMRQASEGDPLFDGEQTEMYRDMYDKQLALDIADKGKGIGLAEMLIKQLQAMPQGSGTADSALRDNAGLKMPGRSATAFVPSPAAASPSPSVSGAVSADEVSGSAEAFVRKLWPLAQKAAAKIGAAPEALLAQAALETGWGKAVIRHPDGTSSHNLFNIKADQRWDGAKVAKSTLEYRQGVASREVAQFRAYGSFAESFDDYVKFLQANPRYAEALRQAEDPKQFVRSLQEAGYATDPAYAQKISSIIDRGIMVEARADLKSPESRTLS